jgi:sucrose-6-phosphate hydrolase SacC (GH32 family)
MLVVCIGMFYFQGTYHFFMQYDPFSPDCRNITWWHAVSDDMVHWRAIPGVALRPEFEYDINGILTGSTTIIDGLPVIMYTAVDSQGMQRIGMATPVDLTDPDLVLWEKFSGNPLTTPPLGRDPSTAWYDSDSKRWMLARGGGDGSGNNASIQGQADVFASKPGNIFDSWTQISVLHSNEYSHSRFWECPDFFDLASWRGEVQQNQLSESTIESAADVSIQRRALKASMYVSGNSINGDDILYLDFMAVGIYNSSTYTWLPGCGDPAGTLCSLTPEEGGMALAQHDVGEFSQLLDGGRVYAGKSFHDPVSDEQLNFAWVWEMDHSQDRRGWSCMQSLPRRLWASSNGNRVCQSVPENLEILRRDDVHLYNLSLDSSSPVNSYSGMLLSAPLPSVYGVAQELWAEFRMPILQPPRSAAAASKSSLDTSDISAPSSSSSSSYEDTHVHVSSSTTTTDFLGGLSVLSNPSGSQQTLVGFHARGDASLMKGVDLLGMDYITVDGVYEPETCADICWAESGKCQSWSFFSNATLSVCSLKTGVPFPIANSSVVSGVLQSPADDPYRSLGTCGPQPVDPQCAPSNQSVQPQVVWMFVNQSLSQWNSHAFGGFYSFWFILDPCTDLVQQDVSEQHLKESTGAGSSRAPSANPMWRLDLRVFVDHSIVEVLEGSGRASITARAYPEDETSQSTRLFAQPQQEQLEVSWMAAWNMSSIWSAETEI